MSTGISWTDETWNPTTGCSKVSEGCRNCYAAALAPRLAAMGQDGYTSLPWTKKNAPENVMLHSGRLEKPLRWKKPRRIFVNSMSDLFHELVPFEFVDRVFAVMALARRHTFQILTKRPERMAEYASKPDRAARVGAYMTLDVILGGPELRDVEGDEMARWRRNGVPWPLPNVWLGTSVEDQRAADARIPYLLKTPAAVRFLSCEPLIGPVRIARHMVSCGDPDHRHSGPCEAYFPGGRVHWVIAGGESGPNHRPMQADWMRSLRDQCRDAGVAFFGKQASGPRNEMPLPPDLRVREMPPAVGIEAANRRISGA
jgi:protein gp37